MALSHAIVGASSRLASWLRFGAGSRVAAIGKRPARPLLLYEFEACPFCRKVREALSELALAVEIRPCPKGGTRFRPEAIAHGGRAQFPYLIDPNNSRALYESSEIVAYLHAEYGAGRPLARPWLSVTGSLASALRGGRGARAMPSRAPAVPLALEAMESCPEARLVRERLCELELPVHITPGPGSGEPVLRDPATATTLRGARAICAYLDVTYSLP